MADVKISGLPALAVPDGGDLLPVVDDPGGTPITKQTTVSGALRGAAVAAPSVTPLTTDQVVLVDDPGGTPVPAKATVAQVVDTGLAGLATVVAAATDEVVIIDDPAGTVTPRVATVGDVVERGLTTLSSGTPLATDEVVLVDDPGGTPAGATASVVDVVEAGLGALATVTPVATDEVVIIDDPAGTADGRVATIADLLGLAVPQYGDLYDTEGTTSNISVGTSYVLFNTFDADADAGGPTADNTTDSVTVSEAGTYKVEGNFSFSGTASITFWIGVAVNGTVDTKIVVKRKLGTGGDVGACGFHGRLTLAASDVVTVRVKSDTVGPNTMTVHAAQFNVTKMELL